MKPIFMTTHPRSCSTAFERIFMSDELISCIHEPFGGAFYYGPERMSERFKGKPEIIAASGCAQQTYGSVVNDIEETDCEGRRVLIKDIAYYISRSYGFQGSLAPSTKMLGSPVNKPNRDGGADRDQNNPTALPWSVLSRYHFTFLIRHPRFSIPSYYRCTIPPLSDINGFTHFMPSEAGYTELRALFDYLKETGLVGPRIAGHDGQEVLPESAVKDDISKVDICVIDADDLLDNPEGIIRAYCRSVGLPFDNKLLSWDSTEQDEKAEKQFAQWKGFHEDALKSRGIKPRTMTSSPLSVEAENAKWTSQFGTDAAALIRETVDANVECYEYLRRFSLKAEPGGH